MASVIQVTDTIFPISRLLETNIESHLYHNTPLTLIQLCLLADIKSVRALERHLNLPVTGSISSMYENYAIYNYTPRWHNFHTELTAGYMAYIAGNQEAIDQVSQEIKDKIWLRPMLFCSYISQSVHGRDVNMDKLPLSPQDKLKVALDADVYTYLEHLNNAEQLEPRYAKDLPYTKLMHLILQHDPSLISKFIEEHRHDLDRFRYAPDTDTFYVTANGLSKQTLRMATIETMIKESNFEVIELLNPWFPPSYSLYELEVAATANDFNFFKKFESQVSARQPNGVIVWKSEFLTQCLKESLRHWGVDQRIIHYLITKGPFDSKDVLTSATYNNNIPISKILAPHSDNITTSEIDYLTRIGHLKLVSKLQPYVRQ